MQKKKVTVHLKLRRSFRACSGKNVSWLQMCNSLCGAGGVTLSIKVDHSHQMLIPRWLSPWQNAEIPASTDWKRAIYGLSPGISFILQMFGMLGGFTWASLHRLERSGCILVFTRTERAFTSDPLEIVGRKGRTLCNCWIVENGTQLWGIQLYGYSIFLFCVWCFAEFIVDHLTSVVQRTQSPSEYTSYIKILSGCASLWRMFIIWTWACRCTFITN